MRQSIIFFAMVMFFLTTGCIDDADGEVKMVTVEEMQTLMELDDVQLVDVRTPKEYKDGHIENAQNIDFNSPTFDADILKLDKTKPVILYCKSGGRSKKCSDKLLKAGFIKIYDLDGGITQWTFKGLKIKSLK